MEPGEPDRGERAVSRRRVAGWSWQASPPTPGLRHSAGATGRSERSRTGHRLALTDPDASSPAGTGRFFSHGTTENARQSRGIHVTFTQASHRSLHGAIARIPSVSTRFSPGRAQTANTGRSQGGGWNRKAGRPNQESAAREFPTMLLTKAAAGPSHLLRQGDDDDSENWLTEATRGYFRTGRA